MLKVPTYISFNLFIFCVPDYIMSRKPEIGCGIIMPARELTCTKRSINETMTYNKNIKLMCYISKM